MRIAICLLLFAAPLSAQPIFPKLAAPEPATSRLGADTLYVIESETPYLLLDSPQGLVTVLEKAGPISVFGKFVDGSKYELREFKAKHLWIVQASGSGRVEMLLVPNGTPKQADVVRKLLDVSGGVVPQPPPTPGGKPAHITFIGPEKSVEALKTNNDATLRVWLAARNIKVHVLKAGEATGGMATAVASAGGEPCYIVQDTEGRILEASRLAGVDAVKASVTALSPPVQEAPTKPKVFDGGESAAVRANIVRNAASDDAARRRLAENNYPYADYWLTRP